MRKTANQSIVTLILLFIATMFSISCGSTGPKEPVANTAPEAAPTAEASPEEVAVAEEPPVEVDETILDRLRTEKWKGDLDGLTERRYIRAMVVYNKTGFFHDGPQPRGVNYESLREFEKFLNKRLNTGNKPIYMVFIPVTREEGFKRMRDGRGDIVAANVPIIPELQKFANFSDPIRDASRQVVVTGPSAPQITTIEDLSGKEVFVRKLSRYRLSLNRLNEQFAQNGKAPVILKDIDQELEDEDILNLVSGGVIGITLIDDLQAGLWSKVFPDLTVHNDVQIGNPEPIGWAVQKNTPKLMALVNEFVKDHKEGTSFGNTLLLRYLKNTQFAKRNTTASEMDKFKNAIVMFKKYGQEYNFDWLMIAAQAYQESTIDQSKASPAGAYGVMQIKPSTASGDPINIGDIVSNMENNINAGVKYMHYIMNRYFPDTDFDRKNRALFAFAAYNAGPARVAGLRRKAEAQGLDPNQWFNNVEVIAAKEIGPETVTYVSNIYKYYVAYKITSSEVVAGKRAKG